MYVCVCVCVCFYNKPFSVRRIRIVFIKHYEAVAVKLERPPPPNMVDPRKYDGSYKTMLYPARMSTRMFLFVLDPRAGLYYIMLYTYIRTSLRKKFL